MNHSINKCARIVAVAATLIVATSARAGAQAEADLDPADMANLVGKLDLTSKQRSAIRAFKDDVRKATVKLQAEIEVASIDLRRELERDAPDEAAVRKHIEHISKLEGQVRTARILVWLEIRKLLDKQQRAALARVKRPADLARRVATLDDEHLEVAERAQAHALRTLARREEELAEHARELARRGVDHALAQRELAEFEAQRARLEQELARMERELERGVALDRKRRARLSEVTISSPLPAKIYVDGKLIGKSPVKLQLAAGSHTVEARWQGYTSKRRVTIAADKDILLEMTPPPQQK